MLYKEEFNMARKSKESECSSCKLDKRIAELLEKFCEDTGLTKNKSRRKGFRKDD